MGKVIRSISLSPRVDEEVKQLISKGFNFSDYVEKCFINDFCSEEKIKREIEEAENHLKELKDKLEELSNREPFVKGITTEEKRFIIDAMIKVDNGYDINAFLQVFNRDFKRDLSLYELRMLFDHYRKQGRGK